MREGSYMNGTDPNKSHSLEYLYKEYVRLSERCASYVKSSFDDFKLFGAVGAVALAWKPIADANLFGRVDKSVVLLYGFIVILFIVIILGIFNALKQSLVVYYLQELRVYEAEIRAQLGQTDKMTFRWTESYPKWRNTAVKRIAVHLTIVLFLIVILFPTIVLLFDHPLYAGIYGFVSLVALAVYLNAAKIIFKEYT